MPIRLGLMIAMLAGGVCLGDVVTLEDGTRIEGSVKRAGQMWRVTADDGTVHELVASKVRSIEVMPTERNQSLRAADRLASLRRSVVNLDSIDDVIDRYERFIEMNAGTDVVEEAKQDLAQWRERREQGLIKLGKDWVTPEERLELIGRSLTLSHDARELMKQSRHSEAEPLLREALNIHPENATALYLRAVLLHEQGKLVPSRDSFEQTRQIIPDHAPTLNNLAVIATRQNRLIAALTLYHQALQVSKPSVTILDNVAEALEAVPQEQRRNPVVQRLSRAFGEQDGQLQAMLAKQGLYRWGAVWVDQEQIQRLREAERQMRAKLEEMSREFDKTSGRMGDVDDNIRETERTMRRIEAESYVRSIDGRIWRTPYPSIYYELERDLRDLRAERNQLERRLDGLRESARRVKQDLPVPQFTGQQRLIGIEGTPLMIPADMPLALLPPAMAAATQSPPTQTSELEPQDQPPAPKNPLLPNGHNGEAETGRGAFAPIDWNAERSESVIMQDPASTPG